MHTWHPRSVPIVTATVAAPWGPIHVAASDRGVVAMEQLVSDEQFDAHLRRRFPREAISAEPRSGLPTTGARAARGHLHQAVRALAAFIDGDLRALEALPLDLEDRSAFDRTVFEAVRTLPPGTTAGYGDVARMIGRSGAARAVGGAVGRCPIGLAIPCHRVIAGDGSLGGYGSSWWGGERAGLDLKRELLAREGVAVPG
jgi:O-6-methylguanine DNA methyltransferase